MEQIGKRTHGHGQQCGDCWGWGGIRGLNGNGGKSTIKIKFLKTKKKKKKSRSQFKHNLSLPDAPDSNPHDSVPLRVLTRPPLVRGSTLESKARFPETSSLARHP